MRIAPRKPSKKRQAVAKKRRAKVGAHKKHRATVTRHKPHKKPTGPLTKPPGQVVQQPSAQPPPVSTPTPPVNQPVPPVPPPPAPPAGDSITSPVAMFSGTFGVQQAARLLWRAGFGPKPGEAEALAQQGLQAAVTSLTRPSGTASLIGPAPYNKGGGPLDPVNWYGNDALYWIDRMIRSDQQLVERLALTFHDWFATNEDGIPRNLMLAQTDTMRANGLGSFQDMVTGMVSDPALILFLSGIKNLAWAVNENFARELQELFTLGADNGYTQTDVHEIARALTGWRYVQGPGGESDMEDFHIDQKCHDWTSKTIYGQTGNWGWADVARFVVNHPDHPAYFVSKLWSYFVTTPPSSSDLSALAAAYAASGFQIRPVVEAILCHPDFYNDATMVKPPVVYVVGMLRQRQIFVDGEYWEWQAGICGQRLYQPPDVGGWHKDEWLDSNTMLGRWQTAYLVTSRDAYDSTNWSTYNTNETPEQAVASALAYWGNPPLRQETLDALTTFATNSVSSAPDGLAIACAQRMNALRHLIAVSPDYQVC
jgi:hypothetical protein